MKRGNKTALIVLLIALAIVVVVIIFWGNITGNVVEGISGRLCTDSDGGKTPNIMGTVSYSLRGKGRDYTDLCFKSTAEDMRVREYYCDEDNRAKSKHFNCPNGCQNGACL